MNKMNKMNRMMLGSTLILLLFIFRTSRSAPLSDGPGPDLETQQSQARYDPLTLTQNLGNSGAEACIASGVQYAHGQKIWRPDPCESCLCLDGETFCWWQQCPQGAPDLYPLLVDPTAGEGPINGSQDVDVEPVPCLKDICDHETANLHLNQEEHQTKPQPNIDSTAAVPPPTVQHATNANKSETLLASDIQITIELNTKPTVPESVISVATTTDTTIPTKNITSTSRTSNETQNTTTHYYETENAEDIKYNMSEFGLQAPAAVDASSAAAIADNVTAVSVDSGNLDVVLDTTTAAPVCNVLGTEYKVGDVLPRDTGNCLQCICDRGPKAEPPRITCSPHDCAPFSGADIMFDAAGF